MSRRLAREELFKLVFEGEIKEENTKDILESYLNREEILQNENEIAFIKKYTFLPPLINSKATACSPLVTVYVLPETV